MRFTSAIGMRGVQISGVEVSLAGRKLSARSDGAFFRGPAGKRAK
jgi:hypothetical protein